MPLIKETTAAKAAASVAAAQSATTATTSKSTTAAPKHHSKNKKHTKNNNNYNSNNNNNSIKSRKAAKSVPVTPMQNKPTTTTNFMPSNNQFDFHAHRTDFHDDDDDDDNDADYVANDDDDEEFMPHTYPNLDQPEYSDDNLFKDFDLDEDSSSLAMITPPPPYDTPFNGAATSKAGATQNTNARKFLFQNREIFNISATNPTTPSGSFASAITPTKISAAAAAMFAAPQMAQLNRKWSNLHRKRRRRNSSSGDSKELDKLVLQSVDWDENEMY